jgi:hypothetical protein
VSELDTQILGIILLGSMLKMVLSRFFIETDKNILKLFTNNVNKDIFERHVIKVLVKTDG